jgi:phage I-like protein
MCGMAKSRTKIALAAHTTALDALPADQGVAIWIQLMPAGPFAARDGRGPWTAGDSAAMASIVTATQKRAGTTEIVIDYDHQSVFGAVPGVGGRAPAAGWIKELAVRDDGIYGRVEWTVAARVAIRRGEYRYLSPVFKFDESGRVQVIVNAALTNTPALNLPMVAARTSFDSPDPDTGENMDKIAQALGLAADADEAAVLAAIANLAAPKTAVASTAAPDPAKFVPVEQVVAMQTEFNSLRITVMGDKAEAAVVKAMEDGKLAPALKDWGLAYAKADLTAFEAFAAAAPTIVVAGGRAVPQTPAAGTAVLSAEDHAVMTFMSLDAAAFLKVRKAENGEAA